MFAERLKSLRKEQNLTQQKIAEKLNISRGSYAQWEAQRTQPSSKSLDPLLSAEENVITYQDVVTCQDFHLGYAPF